jgi:hypothetical protein
MSNSEDVKNRFLERVPKANDRLLVWAMLADVRRAESSGDLEPEHADEIRRLLSTKMPFTPRDSDDCPFVQPRVSNRIQESRG